MTPAGIVALVCVIAVLLLFFVPRRVQDPLLALVSLTGLIAFVATVAYYVREVDLIIVFVIGGTLVAYDFWTSSVKSNGDDRDRSPPG